MDSMRSVLMILGVVLHASAVYSAGINWAVSNPVKSDFFYDLYAFIHVFRIPSFFIIAGFFSGFSILRYGYKGFLAKRTQRIIIPLAATALTVNTLDSYMRFTIHSENPVSFIYFVKNHLLSTFVNGGWVHHLWFLVFLIFYFFIAFFLVKTLKNVSIFKYERVSNLFNVRFLIIILPLFNICLLVLGKFFPPLFYSKIFGVFNLLTFGTYIPFYVTGILFFYRPKLLGEFNSFKISNLIVLLIMSSAYFYSPQIENNLIARLVNVYSYYAIAWVLCAVCFSLFFHFLNKANKGFQYLSEASYSIYLFHQLVVIILGYLFIEINLDIYFKFILIIIFTMAITLLIHHFLVLKLPLVRLLFNGKYRRR
jgi:peptidoglycan/LPS O-acetylase OafA/YrhL